MYNENLIIPGATGLQSEPPTDPRDYILGGGTLGNLVSNVDTILRDRPVLFIDGHGWQSYSPSLSFQKMINGDSNGCVTFSCTHGWEYQCDYYQKNDLQIYDLMGKLNFLDINGKVNINKSIVYVGSQTDPNAGNTVSNVVNWVNKQGIANQSARDWNNTWTKEQFNAPLTPAETNAGNESLKYFSFEHEWLPNSITYRHSPEQIIEALKFSVIRVSVDGRYFKDANGLVTVEPNPNTVEGFVAYSHSVTIIDYKLNEWWLNHDHYTNQFVYFRWDYPFAFGKVFFLKKKPNMFRLIKQTSSPAVYLHCVASGHLYGIADGNEVNGAELLKSFCGGNYFNANIVVIPDAEFSTYQHVGDIETVLFNN